MTVATRFSAKYIPEPNSGCWLWYGAVSGSGYGNFRLNGGTAKAHRVSWELHKGSLPAGLHVLHRCDTPTCVNPDHLFLGNHSTNMRDRACKKRNPTQRLTTSDAQAIRAKYQSRSISQKMLAESYGVSQQLVSKIVNNQVWSHNDPQ